MRRTDPLAVGRTHKEVSEQSEAAEQRRDEAGKAFAESALRIVRGGRQCCVEGSPEVGREMKHERLEDSI